MSTETFEVGEVAVISRPGSRFDGLEVTITEPLKLRRVEDIATGCLYEELTYQTDLKVQGYNRTLVVKSKHLRKKRPPREDHALTRWVDCPYHKQITAPINA
jgi:hypothetical protein